MNKYDDIYIVKRDAISQHRQLANELKKLIDGGMILKGELLPGERTLAKRLGLTRDVVHRAYKYLEGEKLIELYSKHKGFCVFDADQK